MEVAGISELVEIEHRFAFVCEPVQDKIGADKTRTTGDQNHRSTLQENNGCECNYEGLLNAIGPPRSERHSIRKARIGVGYAPTRAPDACLKSCWSRLPRWGISFITRSEENTSELQ